MKKSFDPNNITKGDMNRLADAIDEYVDLFTEVMIIPPELKDKYENKIKEGLRVTEKLVGKLRKGDTSVFKTADEWESLLD